MKIILGHYKGSRESMSFLNRHFSRAVLFFFPTLFFITLHSSPLKGNDLDKINFTGFKEYDEALQESQQFNKPILLYFHGSDWSYWSVKIKQDVLNSIDFQQAIKNQFVYLDVDLPKQVFQDKEVNNQSRYLQEVFSIYQIPCLLMIDCKEQELLRLSSENIVLAEQLAKDLLKIKQQLLDLNMGFKNINALSQEQLQELYLLAEKLNQKEIKDEILNKGFLESSSFFLLEKFKSFVSQNALQSEECLLVKEALANDLEASFTAALIEFQELSKQSKENNLDLSLIVSPLKNYLDKFGDIDLEKTWRVEMILAQLYVEFDLWNSALEHAEIAFNTAPQNVKDEISRSLEYIRLNS